MMNKTSIKHDVALGFLVLITALTISAVAIYYSVAGLAAIFAAAVIPIIIMGSILEVAKLVTAVWLHRFWSETMWWLKAYLSAAVIILMFITSMGIFGFLSKAHVEQTSASTESLAQVERIDSELARFEDIIVKSEKKIKTLETSGTGADQNIQSQIDKEQKRIDTAYSRIEPAIQEQKDIIKGQTSLYTSQIEALDKSVNTLQKYIDQGEIKKAQGMIGAKADGAFGPKTAEAFKAWQDAKKIERAELVTKVETLSKNNDAIKDARKEIKRLRRNAEIEIAESNKLINRLRANVGASETDKANIDTLVDEQIKRIKNANNEIEILTNKKYEIEGEYRKLEAEVGPIKYIAEFIYGEADKNILEEAVRWVIMTIIFVFDPLAVLLLIASQYTFAWSRQRREEEGEDPKDPTPDNTDEERFEDVSDEELRNEELSDEDKQQRDFMFLANAGAPVGNVSSYVIKPEDIKITMPEAVTVDEPDYVPIEEDLFDEPEDEGEDDPFEELFAEIDAKEEAEAKAKDEPAHAVTESIYEDPAEVDQEVETTVDPRIEDLPRAPQGTPEEVWIEPNEETVGNDEQEPDEMDKIYSEAQQESARTVRSKSWLSGGFPTKEE
jgi:peptidoglycan hydrolase-like protein with peptidoglycan-binding domain